MSVTHHVVTVPALRTTTPLPAGAADQISHVELVDAGPWAMAVVRAESGRTLAVLAVLDGFPAGFLSEVEVAGALALSGPGGDRMLTAHLIGPGHAKAGHAVYGPGVEAVAQWRSYPAVALSGLDLTGGAASWAALVTPVDVAVVEGGTVRMDPADVAALCALLEVPVTDAVDLPGIAVLGAGAVAAALTDAAGSVVALYPCGDPDWVALLEASGHLVVEEMGQLTLYRPRPAD